MERRDLREQRDVTQQDELPDNVFDGMEVKDTPAVTQRSPAASIEPFRVTTAGLRPTEIEHMWRLAKYIASTPELRPSILNSPEKVLLVLQAGMEVGLKPMQAIRGIIPLDGTCTIWGGVADGLIQARADYAGEEVWWTIDGEKCALPYEPDRDKLPLSLAANCTVYRSISGARAPYTETFSIADAKRAKVRTRGGTISLWDKSNYQSNPTEMLMRRARSRARSRAFADALNGMEYAEVAFDTPGPGTEGEREVVDLSKFDPEEGGGDGGND
jgi:hypothetical protein